MFGDKERKSNVFIPTFEYSRDVVDITGRSNPEDPVTVWMPFLKEIKERVAKFNKLTINFKLDAFNTSSSMYFNTVFLELEKYSKDNEITVNWYYDSYDEDMEEFGDIYKERFKLNFNLIKI